MPQTITAPVGFSDHSELALASTQSTTLFVAGASDASQGRCSYMVATDDGTRQWMPNIQRCYIVRLSEALQTYEDFDPQAKLLLTVANAANGDQYTYRMGLLSNAASSLLSALAELSDAELNDQVEISLRPGKGQAVFTNLSCIDGDGNGRRVFVPKERLGLRRDYSEASELLAAINARLGTSVSAN